MYFWLFNLSRHYAAYKQLQVLLIPAESFKTGVMGWSCLHHPARKYSTEESEEPDENMEADQFVLIRLAWDLIACQVFFAVCLPPLR